MFILLKFTFMFHGLSLVTCSESELTFENMNFRHFSRNPWTENGPIARHLPIQDSKNPEKRGHTCMPPAGFEPTVLVFERSKAIRVLHRAVTGTRLP
jgi:hypothetical protein